MLKKILRRIGAFLLTIAPYQLLQTIRTLRVLDQQPNPYVEQRLGMLRRQYDLDPPNPLRDAVDRRVFPFGSHR